MKNKLLIILTLIGLLGFWASTASAQKHKTITAGKTGSFHIDQVTQVGDVTLAAGMYTIQHAVENDEDILIFHKVTMDDAQIESVGKEVARVKCTMEPVDQKNPVTKFLIVIKAGQKPMIREFWIRGEKVKHVLPIF